MKKLSIILNYGCSFNCKYCIWKSHKMKKNLSLFHNFDFNLLERVINSGKIHKQISISGGGDPLFNHNKNSEQRKLLHTLLDLLKKNDSIVSLHTRYRNIDNYILDNIDQIVSSYDDLNEEGYKDFLSIIANKNINVRIAKVAMNRQYDYIRDLNYAKNNNYQITFYPNGKKPDRWFLKLKNKINKDYDKLKLITSGNQKIYFQPDNIIYSDYSANSSIKL